MPDLIVLLSHDITDEQLQEAQTRFKCQKVIYPPPELQSIWSQIPSAGELTGQEVMPFIDFLADNSTSGDFILIQGDYGMVFVLVDWALDNVRIPVYATSRRQAVENQLPDGSTAIFRQFRHVNFRKYKRFNDISEKNI